MHNGAIIAKLFSLHFLLQISEITKQDPHWYIILTKQGPHIIPTNKLAQ